ncbi:MAG TPA: hypothetical protein VG326_04930 [Tepidisphaeraceae bacterium]|jgi:hypothetical protein|nr:hypothetical protein [Tepidisphaeraceae bacterium]
MCKQILLTFTVVAIGLAGLSGCNQPRPPFEPNAVQYGDYKQIYVDGYRLKEDTNIDEPPRVVKDQFGLLHITVPIRSVIDRAFSVQYRVTFFDANRHIVNIQSWADKALTPNTPDQIMATSPVPADDFRLDLRLATDLD